MLLDPQLSLVRLDKLCRYVSLPARSDISDLPGMDKSGCEHSSDPALVFSAIKSKAKDDLEQKKIQNQSQANRPQIDDAVTHKNLKSR